MAASTPPLPQVRARALLLITAFVRSARTPLSAAGPGDPPAPPCGEGDATAAAMGRGRVSDAPACRPPLFAWDALFPPAAEAPPTCERPLPSADQLAFFAGALKAVARDAACRAAEKAKALADKAKALRRAAFGARGSLAPGEALLAPPAAAPGGGGGDKSAALTGASPGPLDGTAAPCEATDSTKKAQEAADSATLNSREVQAASRVLVRGADAAARLLSAPSSAAASLGEAGAADTLRAARAAVLLENLSGSIHGKDLRAFLRKEASAEGEAGGAAPPAPPAAATSGPASLAAASAALASAWAKEEAPPKAGGSVEPLLWSDVSACRGARLSLRCRLPFHRPAYPPPPLSPSP